VLPVARCGRRLARQLGASGYELTYEEFDGGHVVRSADVTAALTLWLA
jgi:predicted esterase